MLSGAVPEPWLLATLRGHAGEGAPYWRRVWAMRGLLWAYEPSAADAVVAGLSDEAWRVREMAAKVVARHLVGEAFEEVVRRRRDEVPRVRAAAGRAVVRLTDASL